MAYTRAITNISPYWDDYESYRNFLRVIFNPSKAVQARELTQMQTLGQNQLSQVAGHLFKDGSPIVGAKVELTKDAPYIEIALLDVYEQHASPTVPIDTAVQDLVGTHIQAYTSDSGTTIGTLAKVLLVDNNSGTLRMQLSYNGGEFGTGDPDGKWATKWYTDAEVATQPQKYQSVGSHNSAIGVGVRAKVDIGTVWLNGFFVEIPVEQEIFVTKTGETGTFVIGYEFEEVTLTSDTAGELDPVDGVTDLALTIKDPAGSSNNGAPGADRYMVKVNLVSYDITDIASGTYDIIKNDGTVIDGTAPNPPKIPTNFHQLIKMTNGIVEEKLEKTQYGDILDLLAERTYDESGSYTIEPFSLIPTKIDATTFNYEVGPGRAYVFGYERENISPFKIVANKPRTFRQIAANDTLGTLTAQYGTYGVIRQGPGVKTFDTITSDIPAGQEDHGYGLGDRVTFAEGTGTVTNLTDGVDYYVVPIDKDTFKLASSPTNATAGTTLTISIGSAGNSTLTAAGNQGFNAFDPTIIEEGYLMTGFSGCGASIGNPVRVLFYRNENGRLRIYLANSTDLLTDLQAAKSICSVNTGNPNPAVDTYLNIDPFDVAQSVGYNQPIVELPAEYIKEVTTLNYPSLIKIAGVSVPLSAIYSISVIEGGDTFQGAEDSVAFLVDSNGNITDPNDANMDVFGSNPTGGGSGTINALADHDLPAGTYDFYMLINRPSATVRTKTLQSEAISFTMAAGQDAATIIFNGSTNGGVLTAGTSTRFDVAVIESVFEDPLGANTELDLSDFILDGGQRDMLYDYGSVTRISGDFIRDITYKVTIHYWAFGAGGDFFAMNSYIEGSTYYATRGGLERNIPVYTNESGTKSWALRNCLDFRKPITEEATAKEIAEPLGTITADYDYYLPRKDKVWIDRSGKLGVTEGVPEEFPMLPANKSGTVTLFNIDLIPYLFDPISPLTHFDSDQVNVQLVDHKNYTMDDIRTLETRLRNLEAYSSEVQLELDSYADTVVDADGLPRSKNGIFVDRFTNHAKGSVWETVYRCSMDDQEGMLRCPYEMNHINLEYDSTDPIGTQTNISESANAWANTITLDYSVVSYLEQPLASEYMNINPFAIVVWAGEIIMNPVSDTWIETQYAPIMQIQDPDEAARIRALYERSDAGIPNWGAWRTQVLGTVSYTEQTSVRRRGPVWREGRGWVNEGAFRVFETNTEIIETTEQSTRTGTLLERTGTEVILRDMGERTIDVSRIPWMRTIDIVFEAFGMRPDTVVIPFFATIDVSANVIWDGANPGGLTNKAGYIKGTFTVPEQSFRTGKNVFTLKEQVTDPLTIASIEFRAEGTLYTKQKEILSVEVPVYSTRTIAETELNVTETAGTTTTRWREPIAQTILIEDDGGVFLESIDIFFATKDRYLPVTLWVVETIAGVPGQKRVPFGLVTVDATDVSATDWDAQLEDFRYNGDHYELDGETPVAGKEDNAVVPGSLTDFVPTKFSFSDAIYLKEGVEYAFVLMSNSNNYNAYISRMGEYNIIDGIAIDKQPHMGSLLKSQNTSTWTPDQYADIKFELHRCNFDVSASALYLRTKGETSYWDDIVYAPGEQVIFNHTTAGLNVYQNLIATVATSGHDPESFPLRWTLVREGFYDATLLNISTDDLVIPGTSITRQFYSIPDTAWLDFTNKEDIYIETKKEVQLYLDGETQNTIEPSGLDVALQLFSDSSWHSPVINKNRSFGVLINNLVTGTGPYDAGVYISESTLLKENASSLKLLIDVALPNAQASITPQYRIVKENLRYLAHDAGAGINLFSENIGTKDNLGYVYHMDSDFTLLATVTEKDTVIIDGLDDTNDRVYLSSIGNPDNFVDKTTLPETDPSIFITTEPGILSAEISIWDGSQITVDEYVFDPVDRNLYKALITTTAPPTPTALDWTLIPCVFVDLAVQIDSDVEWRPMQQVGTVKSYVDTAQFVEYEYEPLISPSEEFDNFAIRIDMTSGNEINIPRCKRLRVIAVN